MFPTQLSEKLLLSSVSPTDNEELSLGDITRRVSAGAGDKNPDI